MSTPIQNPTSTSSSTSDQKLSSATEEKIIKVSFIVFSFEVRGYSIPDVMLLIKKAWMFYILMLVTLIALIVLAINFKESLAFALPTLGAIRLWLDKKPP